VKALLVPQRPVSIGLERTFRLLREAVTKHERETQ